VENVFNLPPQPWLRVQPAQQVTLAMFAHLDNIAWELALICLVAQVPPMDALAKPLPIARPVIVEKSIPFATHLICWPAIFALKMDNAHLPLALEEYVLVLPRELLALLSLKLSTLLALMATSVRRTALPLECVLLLLKKLKTAIQLSPVLPMVPLATKEAALIGTIKKPMITALNNLIAINLQLASMDIAKMSPMEIVVVVCVEPTRPAFAMAPTEPCAWMLTIWIFAILTLMISILAPEKPAAVSVPLPSTFGTLSFAFTTIA